MDGVTEGRMVHFVMPNGDHRPAVIVNCWPGIPDYVASGTVNLQVITDGANDAGGAAGLMWITSVRFSEDARPGTWHWIEKA